MDAVKQMQREGYIRDLVRALMGLGVYSSAVETAAEILKKTGNPMSTDEKHRVASAAWAAEDAQRKMLNAIKGEG